MYQEIALLKFLLDRGNFNKYIYYVKDLNLEQESKELLKSIEHYFKDYPDKEIISVEELTVYNYLRNPLSKKKDSFSLFLNKLSTEEFNQTLIEENFNAILEKYFSSEVLFKISEALEQDKVGVLDEVKPILDNFDKVKLRLNNKQAQFTSNNLEEIVKKIEEEPGLHWRIPSITTHLGPIRGKVLGHVFARVDTGKTSFVLSEEAYWVSQLKNDEVIIHFNNEEDGAKLMTRFYQSVLNCDKQLLISRPEACRKEFYNRGGNRLKLYDEACISIEDIEEILKTHNAKIIVVDQSDKLHFIGHSKLGDVARLQMVYAKLRELAKKYNVHILTVGQASQSAENKKWLLLTDLDSSKTLKPGEFDYIIGIGRTFEYSSSHVEDVRYLHLCKNKLGTGQHAQLETLFDATKAIYREPTYSELEEAYGLVQKTTKPEQLTYLDTT